MFGRQAYPGLVAKQLLGQRRLADLHEFGRALHVGKLVDRRIAARKWIVGKFGAEPKSLSSEQAVEAFRRFGG